MRHLFTILTVLIGQQLVQAQTGILTGRITDKYAGESLPTANVYVNENTAVSADLDGNYSLELPHGTHTVEFSFVGYVPQVKEVTISGSIKELNVQLTSIELEEAQVFADIAIDRETPVAFSNIDAKTVEEELASQDIPMLLNSTPGVYATQQGGGDGDARITIRGFSQRNIAVMLDGVPVNDMENGWVYWSNWFGLDAIMQTTQVQRGLGVSKLAIPSVGGTINIVTKGIEQKKQTKIKQELASNGFLRTTFGHTSGRLPGNWGFTLAGSYKQGNGWVDGNWTQGFFYYGKVQKSVGNHIFTVSGFGAPQSHGQRSFSQGIPLYDSAYGNNLGITETYDLENLGLNYNIHSGSLTRYDIDAEGNQINQKTEALNERKNYYHKPQFSIKHSWARSENFSLNTVAYLSIGNGGGTRLDSSTGEDNLNPDGTPDFQSVYDAQTGFAYDPAQDPFGIGDPSVIPAISDTEHVAFENYLKSGINKHFWYGVLSSFRYKPSEKFTYSGGLDLRSYKGEHYREVYDLLGADYLLYKENPNASSGVYREGDIIDYHNDAFVEWGGLFGQLEYKTNLFSSFFSLSSALTRYKRIDYMLPKTLEIDGETVAPIYFWETNAVEPVVQEVELNGVTYTPESEGLKHQETDWYYKPGFTIKTGGNYKVSEKSNVYVNLGYLDRAPRFQNVYDFTNKLFLDIQNEKIKSFEFGYGLKLDRLSSNLNGYITSWENRPVNRGFRLPDPLDPEKEIVANVNGMNARHMGIELETSVAVTSKLTLESIISLGDWIWNSEDTVLFVDDSNRPILDLDGEQVSQYFDARGVHVGDAAQTQFGALLRYQFKKGAYAKLRYTFYDRYFANFDPISLNGESAGRDSWKIPNYSLLELHGGYGIQLSNKTWLNLRGSILNLTNAVYVSDATNNSTFGLFTDQAQGFDAGSAAVFFGQGRRFNLSATLSF